MSTREVHLTFIDGLKFSARSGSGHETTLDSTLASGAAATAGPSPVELLLESLGACGAMDVISILGKMREDVRAYDVDVLGQRAPAHPRVFTSIAVTHRLAGRRLREANVRRAIVLSISRYCPVYAMLSPAVDIQERYEIRDADTGALEATGEVAPDPDAGDAAAD